MKSPYPLNWISILIWFVFFLTGCTTYQQASTIADKSQAVGPEVNVEANSAAENVAAIIAPYQSELKAKMEAVIGQVPETLTKDSPEGTLGNWMADMLQVATVELFPDIEIAFSAQNSGGIRVPEIAAGPLLVGEIYELMPFDNELVVVEMNGFVLQEFINHMAASDGWPVSKELRYVIAEKKAKDIRISGEPLQLNRNYFVGLSDYVAKGGSNAKKLADRAMTPSGRLIRDVLIEYTERSEEPVVAVLDGRVRAE
ncbi:MAG: 5'-nucleotidase [Bacteroidota bacterium]